MVNNINTSYKEVRMMKIFLMMLIGILIVVIFVAPLSLAEEAQEISYPEIDGVFNEEDFENILFVENLDMHIAWLVKGENLLFSVKSIGKGWVAVGFNPSNMMKDANIIIGDVKGEEIIIEDHFGVSNTGHRKDEVDNILQANGSEDENFTVLEFVIPLNSGDDMDQELIPGNKYKVILAYHMSSESLKIRHSNRTSIEIEI